MKTEKLFHELLGLGMNWEVLECEFNHIQGVVRIKIAETARLWEMERSPGEGAQAKLYDHTEELVCRPYAGMGQSLSAPGKLVRASRQQRF